MVEDEHNNKSNSTETTTKWNGVLIEADPSRYSELKILHDPLGNICINTEVSCQSTSPQSLLSILKRDAQYLPYDFDFLSIDVDGIDYWLLVNVLGGGYRPKCICIEFNPTMPIDLIYIQPRSDNIRHGSSLSAMVELCNNSGYTLIETTLFNSFFIRNELYEKYFINEVPDTSIEALHEITMGTELYQLYDGTLKVHGCKKMLWHRLPIDEKKMQMLSDDERQFPFAPSTESNDLQRKSGEIKESAIDVSVYCNSIETSNDNSDTTIEDRKRECYTRLNKTLRKDGFALVKGTGISRGVVSDALQAAKSFLHEADESIRRSCLTKDRARRGYSPISTENFASLIGQQGPNDLVKKFRIGPESNEYDSSSPLHQPNTWPSEEYSSKFKHSIEEYFEQTCHAANCILKAICDGIKDDNCSKSIQVLSESTNSTDNEEKNKSHTSILTLLGYQPGSRHKKGSKGYMRPLVSAHTDVGVITVLHFDHGKCAKLQRAGREDTSSTNTDNVDWIDIDLSILDDDPIFVVNVGDCLSDLSGGSLRSTLHRVMPCPINNTLVDDVARTCLALFVGLEPDTLLELPSGEEALSYEDWRKNRIAKAQSVLKQPPPS